MGTCNVGDFTFENFEDAHKFLKLVQEEDFNDFELANPKLVQSKNGSYYISLIDFFGDIGSDLEKIAAKCLDESIHVTFSISHDDGYGTNGRYEFDGKTFESLSSDECVLRDALTIDLLNELKRRGINVCITTNGKETV